VKKIRRLAFAAFCLLATGCNDTEVVWSLESRSPDKWWIASAESVLNGGPGTAADNTLVYLANASQPGKTQLIAAFDEHETTWRTINLRLVWIREEKAN
jgi:hypothetical protein